MKILMNKFADYCSEIIEVNK